MFEAKGGLKFEVVVAEIETTVGRKAVKARRVKGRPEFAGLIVHKPQPIRGKQSKGWIVSHKRSGYRITPYPTRTLKDALLCLEYAQTMAPQMDWDRTRDELDMKDAVVWKDLYCHADLCYCGRS